jgi:hypothetical protein
VGKVEGRGKGDWLREEGWRWGRLRMSNGVVVRALFTTLNFPRFFSP